MLFSLALTPLTDEELPFALEPLELLDARGNVTFTSGAENVKLSA